MIYEVGDKIIFKNFIFKINAEILNVYDNGEFEDYKYCVKYKNADNEEDEMLIKEDDIVEFAQGTEKYLKQQLNRLSEIYSKETILRLLL